MLRTATAVLLTALLLLSACDEEKKVPSDPPGSGVAKEAPAKPPAGPAVKEAAAKAVLERAVESMGGDAALAKIVSAKFSYEGTYKTDTMRSPFKSEMLFARPDKMLWTLDAGMFKGAVGTSGGVAWSRFMEPVGRAKGARAEAIAEWPDHQDILLVRPLLVRTDVSLHRGDEKEAGGGLEETVRVGFGGRHEYAVTFLTKDGGTFPVRVEGPQTQLDGRRGTMKVFLSRPKKFGDVTLPTGFSSDSTVDGRLDSSVTEFLTAVEWNPEVPENAFAVPALSMKTDTIAARKTESMVALVVVHEGAYDGLTETFGKAFALAAQVGVMFLPTPTCIYLNDPSTVKSPAELRTEILIPLMISGPPPKAPAGAELRAIPEADVAAIVVKGAYGAKEGEAIGRLMEWIAKEEKTPAGPPRVTYFHNPALVVDEDQVAEIMIPIK